MSLLWSYLFDKSSCKLEPASIPHENTIVYLELILFLQSSVAADAHKPLNLLAESLCLDLRGPKLAVAH